MENYKNLRLHMQYKKYRKWNNNEIQTEIWNKDVACKYWTSSQNQQHQGRNQGSNNQTRSNATTTSNKESCGFCKAIGKQNVSHKALWTLEIQQKLIHMISKKYFKFQMILYKNS